GGAVRLRGGLVAVPALELVIRDRLDGGVHVRVLVAAELAALALERPGSVGAEPEGGRLAGDRVELALERRDPPAVVDVFGIDQELDVAVDRNPHLLDLDDAVRVDEVPVELPALDLDDQRRAGGTGRTGPVESGPVSR